MLSLNTLQLCRQLLDNHNVAVSHPEFEQVATSFITAKKELESEIAAVTGTERPAAPTTPPTDDPNESLPEMGVPVAPAAETSTDEPV